MFFFSHLIQSFLNSVNDTLFCKYYQQKFQNNQTYRGNSRVDGIFRLAFGRTLDDLLQYQ